MSWTCKVCGNQVDDQFLMCGNCGSVKGTTSPYYPSGKTKICPKCRTEIDKKATVCPNCQSKIGGITGKGCLLIVILIIGIIILIGLIGGAISGSSEQQQESDIREQAQSMSETEYKSQCRNVTFEELARDKSALSGQKLTFKGEIIQVMDNMYRINITKTEWGYTDTIIFTSDELNINILEGDVVELWGESVGFYDYESILGEKITVPKIVAVYLTVLPDDVTSGEEIEDDIDESAIL